METQQLRNALANLLEVMHHIPMVEYLKASHDSGIHHSAEVAAAALAPVHICVSKCKVCLPDCPFNPIN